jgi:urease accessory protein UreH
MTTRTSIPSIGERPPCALVAVEVRDGRHVVTRVRCGPRLVPRVIARGSAVTVAVTSAQAGPLAGDTDVLRIKVGPGAALALAAVAGTIALPGAAETTLRTEAVVGGGGALILDDPVLVVAEGACVRRRTVIDLAEGAVAAIREAVVLGRADEAVGTGRLDAELVATFRGTPLLHDGLRIEPGSPHAWVALAPGHRALVSACLLGVAPDPREEEDPHLMRLAGPGALRRASAADLATAEAACAATWRRMAAAASAHGATWRRAVSRAPQPPGEPLVQAAALRASTS